MLIRLMLDTDLKLCSLLATQTYLQTVSPSVSIIYINAWNKHVSNHDENHKQRERERGSGQTDE